MMNPLFLPLLAFLSLFFTTSTATFSTLPQRGICTVELMAISPCLPFISSPPNNISTFPSPQCCDLFCLSFITNRTATCLCYILRCPSILGFPINSTKLLSLSSVCHLGKNLKKKRISLQSLCEGSRMLPPLESTSGLGTSPSPSPTEPLEPSANSSPSPSPSPSPSLSDEADASSPVPPSLPPESDPSSPVPRSSLPGLKANSSTTSPHKNNGGQFSPGVILYLVSIFIYLLS